MRLNRLPVVSATPQHAAYVKRVKRSVTAAQLTQERSQNGHTGARTLDRSVISTVLYRLSYTTGRRNTHPRRQKSASHARTSYDARSIASPRVFAPPRAAQQSPLRLYTFFHSIATYRPSTQCLDSPYLPSAADKQLVCYIWTSAADSTASIDLTCTTMSRRSASL